jgi:hypothetical protein
LPSIMASTLIIAGGIYESIVFICHYRYRKNILTDIMIVWEKLKKNILRSIS